MQFWPYTIVLQKHFDFFLLFQIAWLAFGNTLMQNEPKLIATLSVTETVMLIRNYAMALYNCLAEVFCFCSSPFNSLAGLWQYSHAK